MSPGTFYSVLECLPEYGLAAHFYVADKQIRKVTFSVFKMVQEEGVPMRVIPVDTLYRMLDAEKQAALFADLSVVHLRVTGRPIPGTVPAKEYELG